MHRSWLKQHHEDPNSIVIDEWGLEGGEARVDIAVINGCFQGYEIKGDGDSLRRLPAQIDAYSSVMDHTSLVTTQRHYTKAKAILPSFWGIIVVEPSAAGSALLFEDRPAARNRSVSPLAIAAQLWRPELVSILDSIGADAKLLRRPKWILCEALVLSCRLEILQLLVSEKIRQRKTWRDLQSHS
ncbi:sce7726 family protein [Ferrovibrio sp.]|uniref:sce7726 family protein n=1 Tax=Ferrovibrio sp. TaxID=1917215 RepID=UPI0035135E29